MDISKFSRRYEDMCYIDQCMYRQKYPWLFSFEEDSSYDDGFTDGSTYEGTHEVWVSDGKGGLKKVDRPNNSFD